MHWRRHALTALFWAAPAAAQHATYALDVEVVPQLTRLNVAGTVSLPAIATRRDTIRFVVSSLMRDVKLDVVRPAIAAKLIRDSAEGDRSYRLVLSKPLAAGAAATIRFSYHADSLREPQLRITETSILAASGGEIWYPRLGYDSTATGTLTYRVPPGQTVVSTGTLDERASSTARGRFTFRVDTPALFAFTAAPFVRYTTTTPRPLTLYLLRERADAQALLTRFGVMLRALESQFGALPFREYAMAEVEFGGSTGGTSEYGFFLADKSIVASGLPTPFIAHELGHAWWGNMVRTRPGPGRMLLTEGIASFGMLRALEAVEGQEALRAYRESRYPGYERSGSPAEYFNLAAAGIELPLGTTEPKTGIDILTMHRMANTRGWFLLDMLSREVGREAFAKILRDIVARYRGAALTFADFRREVERAAAPRDVSAFFDAWFNRTGAPVFVSDWTQRDSALAFAARIGARADTLERDPNYEVLHWTEALARTAERDAGLTRAEFRRRFGSAQSSIALYRAALDSVPPKDTSGLQFALRVGLATALASTSDTAAARRQLDTALSLAVKRASLVPAARMQRNRLMWAQGNGFRLVDSIAEAEFRKDSLGSFSLAIVNGKDLVWSKSYGFADRQRTQRATPANVYRIASITKQFTAVALLQLADRKALMLSDPVDRYVPEVRSVRGLTNAPTLVQLATMTSGLARDPMERNKWGGPLDRWMQTLFQALPGTESLTEPGTTYRYSNVGYAILGAAVSRAANTSFVDYVRARIIQPLGMTSTDFVLSDSMRSRLATGVDWDVLYKDTLNYEDAANSHRTGPGIGVASGGLYSTVGDLAKLISLELGFGPDSVLSERAVKQRNAISVVSPSPALEFAYGFGTQILRWRDTTAVGHSGNTAGYTSQVVYDPARAFGVIVLRSAGGGEADAGRLAWAAFRKLVSLEARR